MRPTMKLPYSCTTSLLVLLLFSHIENHLFQAAVQLAARREAGFHELCLLYTSPADMAFQEKVIDCFVNSIYLFDDHIVLNFNYKEGGRPVSLEQVLGSFLDEHVAPKYALHESGGRFVIALFQEGTIWCTAVSYTHLVLEG